MEVVEVHIGALREDEDNARVHSKRNLAAIRASLEEFGQVEPLVVRAGTNTVIGGNGRLRCMYDLGWETAQVAYQQLSDEQALALGVALNRTGELAEWDVDKLSEILEALDTNLLGSVGWQDDELAALKALNVGLPELDPGKTPGATELTIDDLDGQKNQCPRCEFRF